MEIEVVESARIDPATGAHLRELWRRAFDDGFSDDDADHAYGGVHVLVRDGDDVVGHAAAVPRRLRFGAQPWVTVGYVEAVAVHPGRQGAGVGRELMRRLGEEIATRWPVAMLSTGRATGFYERLGWEQWQGLSYTSTTAGRRARRPDDPPCGPGHRPRPDRGRHLRGPPRRCLVISRRTGGPAGRGRRGVGQRVCRGGGSVTKGLT